MWFQIFLQKDFQVNLVIIIFDKKKPPSYLIIRFYAVK